MENGDRRVIFFKNYCRMTKNALDQFKEKVLRNIEVTDAVKQGLGSDSDLVAGSGLDGSYDEFRIQDEFLSRVPIEPAIEPLVS